jgi:Skp family chaperone for outer membrane proteins
MRYTVGCALLIGCLLAAAPAVAGKIGFVDAERAVASVEEGQAKLKSLDEWARPERERVEGLRDRVNELRQQIAQQRPVASAEALQAVEQEELEARRAFEDARRTFERELEVKQNEFLADVAVKVGTVASDYGRANDFDAIFVLKAQPLVYVAESADLTEVVIRMYNERFPYREE